MLPLLRTTAYVSLMKRLGQDHWVLWWWDGMKFSKAAITYYHKTVGVKTEEMSSLTFLEAKCIKSSCWEGHVLCKGSRGGSLLPSHLWHSLVCRRTTSVSFSTVTWRCQRVSSLCLSDQISFFCRGASRCNRAHRHPCDFILIFLLWQDSMHFQVSSHSQVLGLRTWAVFF